MHLTAPPVPGYTIGDRLGGGAAGVVHEAVHADAGAAVALKLVPIAHARHQVALETEVLAMARLHHPHLLAVYDYGLVGKPHDRWMWMALELASGGALTRWAPRRWTEVQAVLEDVLAGLAHAHARGMVHRDLKPANLLRSGPRDHRPGLKIGDFGLTTVRGEEHTIRRGGTPLYIPPEQADPSRGPLGPWTDLYALGAVLWEWLTGAPVFEGTPADLLLKHLEAPLPAFRARFPVPKGVEPLLQRMLAKEPDRRPDAVAAVQHALGWVPASVSAALAQTSASRATARLPGIGAGLLPLRDLRLVGRRTERQTLVDALERAITAWRPEVVLLSGPAGVGKTRLMRWMAETAAEAGVARIAWEPSDVDQALKMAWRGPVVACFDELDLDSEALVAALAFAAAPVLVLATTRQGQGWDELDALPAVQRVHLAPMQPTPFRALLHRELGLSEELTVRMDERCGFVPGVATAWMQQLAQEGRLHPSPTGFTIGAADLSTPPAADGGAEMLLQALMDEATPADRDALRAAALLERVVDAEEWRALLTELGLPYPDELLRQLARTDLVLREGDGFAWVSNAVKEATLQTPGTAREHLAAARVLAAMPPTPHRTSRQGLHLLHAGLVAEGRAVLLVHRPIGSPEEAELARHVVEAVRPTLDGASDEEWFHFLYLELRVLTNLVSAAAALPVARALVERLEDPGDVSVATATLHQEALEAAARVVAFAGSSHEARAVLEGLPDTPEVLRCKALIAWSEGRGLQAEALYRRAMADTDDPARLARMLIGMGAIAGGDGRHDEARAWFEQALERIEPELRHHAEGNLARSLLCLQRPDEALVHARSAYEQARRWGAQRVATEAVVYGIAAALADEDELEAVAEQALYSARRYGVEGADLLAECLRGATPQRRATYDFLAAMRHALKA